MACWERMLHELLEATTLGKQKVTEGVEALLEPNCPEHMVELQRLGSDPESGLYLLGC